MGLMEKIFGTYSDRELKKIEPLVNKVMSLEGEMENFLIMSLKKKLKNLKIELRMVKQLMTYFQKLLLL